MKCSFTTMATPGMPLGDILALVLKNKFDGLDIRYHDNQGEIKLSDNWEKIDEVAKKIKEKGLVLPSILCYNNWPDHANGDWTTAIAEFHQFSAVATRLGAKAVRLFPRVPKNPEELTAYLADTALFFKKVLSQTKNISIYLQNHEGSLNARQTAALCKEVNDERLGMVYSPDHVFLMNEPQEGVLEEVAFCVKEIFIADIGTDRKGALPGTGVVPLKETIQFFQRRHFEGFYTFKWEKIWQPQLVDAAEVFPLFVQFIALV